MSYFIPCMWASITAGLLAAPMVALYWLVSVSLQDAYTQCSGRRIVLVAAAFCTCWPLGLFMLLVRLRT